MTDETQPAATQSSGTQSAGTQPSGTQSAAAPSAGTVSADPQERHVADARLGNAQDKRRRRHVRRTAYLPQPASYPQRAIDRYAIHGVTGEESRAANASPTSSFADGERGN